MSGTLHDRSDAHQPPGIGGTGPEGSDEQLMTAFAGGQADAFNELFSRYKQPLFGFFRRRVLDAAQAEELTQETFFAVLRAASRYQRTAMFRTYLYAVGFKILIGYRRKAAFRATFLGSAERAREPQQSDPAEAEFMLREAVNKLDATDREVLMLREFEQLSYAEIAEVLSLPLNTVRTRLFCARIALRELLTSPGPGAHAHSTSGGRS